MCTLLNLYHIAAVAPDSCFYFKLQVPIRPNLGGVQYGQLNTNLSGLPPGTAIISSGQNLQGVQGYALVPAQYVTQVRARVSAVRHTGMFSLEVQYFTHL